MAWSFNYYQVRDASYMNFFSFFFIASYVSLDFQMFMYKLKHYWLAQERKLIKKSSQLIHSCLYIWKKCVRCLEEGNFPSKGRNKSQRWGCHENNHWPRYSFKRNRCASCLLCSTRNKLKCVFKLSIIMLTLSGEFSSSVKVRYYNASFNRRRGGKNDSIWKFCNVQASVVRGEVAQLHVEVSNVIEDNRFVDINFHIRILCIASQV